MVNMTGPCRVRVTRLGDTDLRGSDYREAQIVTTNQVQ